MNIFRGLPAPPLPPYPVLTIGNFDGQHVGHLALVSAVIDRARRCQGTPMALTFDPHPAVILSPGLDLQFLSSPDEKIRFFKHRGIQGLVILEFTHTLAARSPQEFVRDILVEGLGIRELFVGKNFVFGKGRSGNVQDLMNMGSLANFHVHPVAPVCVDGMIVSSTRIRTLILKGRIKEAAGCLGHPYGLKGHVVPGEGRGTKLGWPTANVRLPINRVIPPDGVYVTTTMIDGTTRASISYIGTRPTFHQGERLLEVHVLDENLSLYGKELHVNFLDYVRGDQTFPQVSQLLHQMKLDVKRARETFHASRGTPQDTSTVTTNLL